MPNARTSKGTKPPEMKSGSPKPDTREQAERFEKAMALFHKRDFAKARELFAQIAAGPNSEWMHAARMHERMCERRLEGAKPPKSAEDHYTLGVALLNLGALDRAEEHLRKGVQANDRGDHLHYALALCLGLRGDLEGCYRHLSRAIEIAPQNRIAARNDGDFQALAKQSPLRELLNAERGVSA
jgi:tetratricopeptide (TPR) repeat protein